jgi:tetratricopeptide (TPR) repeat protein
MPDPSDHPDGSTDLTAADLAERRGDLAAAAAAFAAAAESANRETRARALMGLGRVAWRQTRLAESLEHYSAARFLAEELDSLDLLAEVENGIGAIHYARGEYDRARTSFRASLALSTDDAHNAKVALNLGVLANIAGDYEDAERQYRHSLDSFQRGGDTGGEALALHNLAMLHADRAEWDAADTLFTECLARADATGNRQLVGDTLLNRAEVFCGKGDFTQAVSLCDQAIVIHHELGDGRGRAEALRWRGHAYAALGDRDRAESSLLEAHRAARALRNALLEAEAARELGILAEHGRLFPAASDWFRQALALFTKLGAMPDMENVSARLSRIDAESEEPQPGS